MSETAFTKDINKHGGYAYTIDAISGKVSNARITKSFLAMESFAGKRIIDIGCGDGTYSYSIAQQGAAMVVAIDPVENAVMGAAKKYKNIANLKFETVDLYNIEIPSQPYDVAILRGVLHHLPDLEKGIEIACKLAKRVLVAEPNGYNPVLKIIEKTSRYHIEHQEQSFLPSRLRAIFAKNSGKVIRDEFIGLVPFFCPNWMVPILKFFEPFVEKLPLINRISCGQYIFLTEISR